MLKRLLAVVAVSAAFLVAVNSPASAENNGVGSTPALGWSSWSFIRHDPTAANIEATADAMVASGLSGVGYEYVNVDDFWYVCPGSQGPNVDQYGRWVTDTAKFPAGPGGENGIQVVADYVHSKGLKFGLYVTPGLSKQAVAQNTPIEGTPYHAADIATTADEKNYNCKGMVGIDYSKPGAQAFVDSWANQFAGWGVDYVKIDGVGTPDIPDVQAWSDGLQATGRPIHLELSNNLDINNAPTWAQLSNGWRTGGDVECYCGPGGASYPLTDWGHVSSRFNQVANWAPFGGPGAFNDYDSIEVGNGTNDGLTLDERQTQLSLWALAASPFILGTDLTHVDPTDLALLKNTAVLSVDQDAIDATRIVNTGGQQVFTKKEPNGDAIVGLFNTDASPQPVSTTATALGLPASAEGGYTVDNLWTHQNTDTAGVISANVPAHGVALYRVTPTDNATHAPPSVVFTTTGLDNVTAGQPATVTESFTDNGVLPAQHVRLSLAAPADWKAQPTTPTSFGAVESGQTVQASWQVTVAPPSKPFSTATVNGSATYTWPRGDSPLTATTTTQVTLPTPVTPPYHTFSSTSPAATFGEAGNALAIRAAGSDVSGATNQYGAIYLPNAEQDGTVDTVKVDAQANTNASAKAGLMVRNDAAQSGTSPGFVILAATPSNGYVLQWDANGDGQLDSTSPATAPATYPSWLRLTRSGTTFTGSYSTDGSTWTPIGSADVASAAASQDAGVFTTAHSTTVGEADFSGLTVGPPGGLIDAARTTVTLPGQATPVSATFYDHGSSDVSGVAVTLSAPAGWTVSPTAPVQLGTVAAGGNAKATWQVTAPADASPGPAPLDVVASYTDGAHAVQSRATITAVVPSTDLSSAFNNVGITDDTNTSVGNIDGAGSSLSAQALASVGVTPGSAITHSGMQFGWPNVPAGQSDNVVAAGQSFQLSGAGANLGFLTTATYGPATGTGTITYSDGTTQQYTLTVADWYSNPPSGSDSAITMAYRNRSGNTQQSHGINVFVVKVPLLAGRTPTGVTLPNLGGPVSGSPAIHVFAIAVGS
jgi:regulation of enolase protein 1 (concanavalin A-like superfamily)